MDWLPRQQLQGKDRLAAWGMQLQAPSKGKNLLCKTEISEWLGFSLTWHASSSHTEQQFLKRTSGMRCGSNCSLFLIHLIPAVYPLLWANLMVSH